MTKPKMSRLDVERLGIKSPSLTDASLARTVTSIVETRRGYGQPPRQTDDTDWRNHGNVAVGGPIERRKVEPKG